RYASATELQADLNLFLAGRSLRHARKIEQRLIRFKHLALAACGVLAVAGLAVWFARNQARQAQEREALARGRARSEAALRARAESAERESRLELYNALVEKARATVRSSELGHRTRALDAIQRAAAISNSVELRAEAMAAMDLPDLRFERKLTF